MVAVPAAIAVTIPFATVATLALLVLHVTFWLVAFDGDIATVRVSVPPTTRLVDALMDTPVTAILLDPLGVPPGVVPPPMEPNPESQDVIEKANTANRAIMPIILFKFFIAELLFYFEGLNPHL
jgi:hypothetical protein